MTYEFGESFPQIARLKLMRRLLISLSITYLLVDLFYNLFLPACCVIAVILVEDQNNRVWRESMQLVSDLRIQLVLAFNIQMVYFYYKLALPSQDNGTIDVIETNDVLATVEGDRATFRQSAASGSPLGSSRVYHNDSF